MEERLIELETRVAYQERTLEVLNEIVVGQRDQIDRLEEQVRALKVQVRAAAMEEGEGDGDAVDEPPPHY